ncbi:MAG: hypothetical protein AAGF13_05775, partial [Pseudomonadota bacterium]
CEQAADDAPGALALWRATVPSNMFDLFVNSFDADRLVAIPDNGPPVECENISADISVAFDRVCRLPFGLGEGALSIRLIPIKDGRRGRAETIRIDLP